jgi:hypothetical protein
MFNGEGFVLTDFDNSGPSFGMRRSLRGASAAFNTSFHLNETRSGIGMQLYQPAKLG